MIGKKEHTFVVNKPIVWKSLVIEKEQIVYKTSYILKIEKSLLHNLLRVYEYVILKEILKGNKFQTPFYDIFIKSTIIKTTKNNSNDFKYILKNFEDVKKNIEYFGPWITKNDLVLDMQLLSGIDIEKIHEIFNTFYCIIVEYMRQGFVVRWIHTYMRIDIHTEPKREMHSYKIQNDRFSNWYKYKENQKIFTIEKFFFKNKDLYIKKTQQENKKLLNDYKNFKKERHEN